MMTIKFQYNDPLLKAPSSSKLRITLVTVANPIVGNDKVSQSIRKSGWLPHT